MSTPAALPNGQHAVQLIAPGELTLNTRKPVTRPGPHQVLAKVECVCLCFSDLKLLKQFDQHPRKTAITGGLAQEILAGIPSYVPGKIPAVPGHEVVVRIVAVGDQVKRHSVGERCLVQADYRGLPTAASNAAFGYNFEGGLQEYVILDERVIVEAGTGERYLIPVKEALSASAVALVEPWACVEDSYVTRERSRIKPGGCLAVIAEGDALPLGVGDCFAPEGKPASLLLVGSDRARLEAASLGVAVTGCADIHALPTEGCDDIVYFGSDKKVIETLNDKLANGGILAMVTAGRKIGAPVSVGVGRVHYGMTRWIGTGSAHAAEAYATIPQSGEIRDNDRICVTGAGGPMGQMHVIRDVCTGRRNLSMVAVDFDDARLASLMAKAEPMARRNQVTLISLNPQRQTLEGTFSYHAIMAPLGALVADSIRQSAPGCRINIFAGIPATVRHELDLDRYIANRCFMFGTSGSTIDDMKRVLEKVSTGTLDTNSSVDAICGMAGAIDGLAAVENRTLAGKIVIYPALHDLGLIPLVNLHAVLPAVAAQLDHGVWSRNAEQELLRGARPS
jgi:threonine dehydrogenase-like Zn-dependent dehydrogenase